MPVDVRTPVAFNYYIRSFVSVGKLRKWNVAAARRNGVSVVCVKCICVSVNCVVCYRIGQIFLLVRAPSILNQGLSVHLN